MDTRDITFEAADGHPMRAALALPSDPKPHAGVVVIHEIMGLTDDIRRITGRLGDMGYAAMTPDLYDGYGSKLICIARTMRALGRASGRPFDDLEAARTFLQKQPGVDPSRIGAIGFCMGGGFALLWAARAPLGASAVLYGEVPADADTLRGACPVIAGYGGRDRMLRGRGERLERLLDEVGVEHDVKIYPEAGHSFMNRHEGILGTLAAWGPMEIGYNAEAAEDSWKRIEAFFARHLGAGDVAPPGSGRD